MTDTQLRQAVKAKGFKRGVLCRVIGEPFKFRTMTHSKLLISGNNVWADGTSPFLIMRKGEFVTEICKTNHN